METYETNDVNLVAARPNSIIFSVIIMLRISSACQHVIQYTRSILNRL